MLAPLDNETIFKKVFTDTEVFHYFVKDLFGVEITVSNIETEKRFEPPIAGIDIKLDIYAESDDHRFVVEIQKIDYDYNFNRFLNYFISLLVEQQKRGDRYAVPQTVLGVVVLTSPYRLNQLTGEPIKESVMAIDFDPRSLADERVRLWNHKLLFLNSNPRYNDPSIPRNYQDWLDLFRASIDRNISMTLNVGNRGIAKATELADFSHLDPTALAEMKIEESKRAMLSLVETEKFNEGKIEGKIEVAKNLKNKGVPIEIIIDSTGLTREEVEAL
jgi:predicted transposase/invertase (TIGR01784 family)